MYSVMQAAGLVCDHLVTCYKYQESSAENSPVTDSPLEGEKSADSWQRISLPEWRASNIIESRAGAVDVYPHEFRRASANSSDPVWAELPKIEEAREDELEKQEDEEDEDEEAYDDISSSSKCGIPVCWPTMKAIGHHISWIQFHTEHDIRLRSSSASVSISGLTKPNRPWASRRVAPDAHH
jgi:hypothetical protein